VCFQSPDDGCGCDRRLEAQVIALVKQDNPICLLEKVSNVLDIVLYVLTAHLHVQELIEVMLMACKGNMNYE